MRKGSTYGDRDSAYHSPARSVDRDSAHNSQFDNSLTAPLDAFSPHAPAHQTIDMSQNMPRPDLPPRPGRSASAHNTSRPTSPDPHSQVMHDKVELEIKAQLNQAKQELLYAQSEIQSRYKQEADDSAHTQAKITNVGEKISTLERTHQQQLIDLTAQLGVVKDEIRKTKIETDSQNHWSHQEFASKDDVQRLRAALCKFEEDFKYGIKTTQQELEMRLNSNLAENEMDRVTKTDMRMLEDRLLERIDHKMGSKEHKRDQDVQARIEELQACTVADLATLKKQLDARYNSLNEEAISSREYVDDTVRKAMAKIETVDSKITAQSKSIEQTIDNLEQQVIQQVKMPAVKTEISRTLENRINEIMTELATKTELRSRYTDMDELVQDIQGQITTLKRTQSKQPAVEVDTEKSDMVGKQIITDLEDQIERMEKKNGKKMERLTDDLEINKANLDRLTKQFKTMRDSPVNSEVLDRLNHQVQDLQLSLKKIECQSPREVAQQRSPGKPPVQQFHTKAEVESNRDSFNTKGRPSQVMRGESLESSPGQMIGGVPPPNDMVESFTSDATGQRPSELSAIPQQLAKMQDITNEDEENQVQEIFDKEPSEKNQIEVIGQDFLDKSSEGFTSSDGDDDSEAFFNPPPVKHEPEPSSQRSLLEESQMELAQTSGREATLDDVLNDIAGEIINKEIDLATAEERRIRATRPRARGQLQVDSDTSDW